MRLQGFFEDTYYGLASSATAEFPKYLGDRVLWFMHDGLGTLRRLPLPFATLGWYAYEIPSGQVMF